MFILNETLWGACLIVDLDPIFQGSNFRGLTKACLNNQLQVERKTKIVLLEETTDKLYFLEKKKNRITKGRQLPVFVLSIASLT